MPFERLFLGTGAHCLHAVRDVLVSNCPGEPGELNLSHILLALPSGRANRRLQDLLLEYATAQSQIYAPPTFITLGRLPEYFMVPEHRRSSRVEEGLVWLRVLHDASPADLESLLGRGDRTSEAMEELAERIARLTRELSGARLTFADVAAHDMIVGTYEERRWQALSNLLVQRNALLSSAGLEPRDVALQRLCDGDGVLDHGDITTLCFISADLNQQQRCILDRLADSGMDVVAMVHADETDADAFDDHGSVVPDAWTLRTLPVADEHLRIVDDVEEQVTTAILHAAFIPFCPIKDVDIPMDHQTQKHRGFGFVTFEETCVYSPSPTLQLRFFHFAIFWQPNVCVEGARRPTPTARPHPRHAPHADPMRSPFILAQTFPQRGRGGGDG